MLRIIAGKHKGRVIETPPNRNVRPTSARVREAVFNILTHRVFGGEGTHTLGGKRVIDLFCGSGALGVEALSRGAEHVTFVDQSSDVLGILKRTLEKIGETQNTRTIRSDSSVLPRSSGEPCDVAFLDPPYRSGLAVKALSSLRNNGWLKQGATAVVEIESKEPFEAPEGFTLTDRRDYGNSAILLLEAV